MGNSFGNSFRLSIFGESHGPAVGLTIDGLPPGFAFSFSDIEKEMKRRIPGKNHFSSSRNEKDVPEIISGLFNGKTTGTPLCVIFRNEDANSCDYSALKDIMRPGHSDYPGFLHYNGFQDYRGGGHFSGRLTAPMVFCGAICKQLLSKKSIFIGAHISRIGSIKEDLFDENTINEEKFEELRSKEIPTLYAKSAQDMEREILEAKKEGDSVGGIIECAAMGIPPGVGEPFFDSVESILAHLLFSVPAVKGVEFGLGFEMSEHKGSFCNDSFYYEGDRVLTKTNCNGGLLGGLTTGMPVVFKVAVKPTPSIEREQKTVDIAKKQDTVICLSGRHDPCIVPRAVPVIEAVCAIGIYECLKRNTDGNQMEVCSYE